MKKLILLFTCILFISGCYDYKELKDSSVLDKLNFDDVFKETKIPICDFTCDVCQKCTHREKYIYLQDGIVREKSHDETNEVFKDFKEIK